MANARQPATALAGIRRPPSAATTTPSAVEPAARGERLAWLDNAKGLGILLVVIGHAAGGLIDLPDRTPPAWMLGLFFTIYAFHMPLFFCLSAVLVDGRIAKNGRRFLTSLGERFVYPYVLWSIVQLTIISLAGAAVNAPLADYWSTILALPWAPPSQFWFLYALFCLHVAALLLVPRVGIWGFLGLMLVLRGVHVAMPLPGIAGQTAIFGIFYAIGVAIGPVRAAAVKRLPPLMIAALTVAFVIALMLPIRSELVGMLAQKRPHAAALAAAAWQFSAIPAAVLGSVIAIAAAAHARGAIGRWLGILGNASMAIYLTHVIFIAGSRIVIGRLAGPIDAAILLPLLVAIGVSGPLVAQRVAVRLKIARALALQ